MKLGTTHLAFTLLYVLCTKRSIREAGWCNNCQSSRPRLVAYEHAVAPITLSCKILQEKGKARGIVITLDFCKVLTENNRLNTQTAKHIYPYTTADGRTP